jgi:hypothetical protein
LFQAERRARMAGTLGFSMTDPLIRHTLPNDNPTLTRPMYYTMPHCI